MVANSPLAVAAVTLSRQEVSVFQDALRAVSMRAHITIVAEDSPLRPRVFGKAPVIPPNTSAVEALGKIADAYDYGISRVGLVFVLKKRYTDPRDLPAVTLDECTQSLRDVAQALDAMNPDPMVDSSRFSHQRMQELVASLSTEQIQAMQAKTADAGLPLASLNSFQQNAFRQFVGNLYLGASDDSIHSALGYLRQSPQITLRVQKIHRNLHRSARTTAGTETQTWTQETVLGYDAVDVLPQPNFHPFTDLPPAPDDPTPPLTEARPAPGSGAEGYTTLEKAVSFLGTGSKKSAVDAALRSKPVSVYGMGWVKPDALLSALADVYGLRVGEDDKGRKTLSRPLFILPLTLADLPNAVCRAMPQPLLRTLPDGDWKRDLLEEQKAIQGMRPEPNRTAAERVLLTRLDMQTSTAQLVMFARPDRLHREAVSRLQMAVDAQLTAQSTSEEADLARGPFTAPVRLSALPASAQSAFGMTFMTGLLENVLHTLGQRQPQWVADVDRSYLMGGPRSSSDPPDGPRFKLWIGYADSDGRLNQTAGENSW